MNILDRGWKRVLIALFLAGLTSKAIAFITFEKVRISAFLIAFILFFVLGNIYNKSQKA